MPENTPRTEPLEGGANMIIEPGPETELVLNKEPANEGRKEKINRLDDLNDLKNADPTELVAGLRERMTSDDPGHEIILTIDGEEKSLLYVTAQVIDVLSEYFPDAHKELMASLPEQAKERYEETLKLIQKSLADIIQESGSEDPLTHFTRDRTYEIQAIISDLEWKALSTHDIALASKVGRLEDLLDTIAGDYLDRRTMRPDNRMHRAAKKFLSSIKTTESNLREDRE